MKQISLICICFLLFLSTNVHAAEEVKLFDSPVNPETYLIRPGDELLVTFISSKQLPITLDIDPECKVVHETIGVFDFQNKTLEYAKSILVDKLKQLYNVKEIEVSITTPREVTITIYGSVRRPGIYKGLTSDRVSSIIELAGGLTRDGSKRNIMFLGGENKAIVDLDKATHLGDVNSNPQLYAGHIINIPSKSSETIHITGDVNFPREIELKKDDDLSMLIQLAGGFKNSATMSDIQIIRGNKVVESKKIQYADIIEVKSSTSLERRKVKLFGAVINQGVYNYSDGITLDELLSQAGGYELTANKNMTTVFRQPFVDSRGRKSKIRYPISIPIQNNKPTSLQLEINDSIFVPWQVGFVKVHGAVLNPGYFPYAKDENILYYINSAGGFLPTANTDELQIFNPISRNTITVTSGVIVPDGAEIVVQVKEELK